MSLTLQFPEPLLCSHVDLNERVVILEVQSELRKNTTVKPIIVEVAGIRSCFEIVEIDLGKLGVASTDGIQQSCKMI